MKVVALFNGYCPCFKSGSEYLAYELFRCQTDCNFLSSYGLVVIDEDGDAITSDSAYRIWNIKFKEV